MNINKAQKAYELTNEEKIKKEEYKEQEKTIITLKDIDLIYTYIIK